MNQKRPALHIVRKRAATPSWFSLSYRVPEVRNKFVVDRQKLADCACGMKAFSVLVFLLGASLVRADQTEISLNGDSWTISDSAGRVKELQATVPGQVHLDLLHHGIIGTPYAGWNDWLEQWVGYDNWIYSRSFQLSQSEIQGKIIWLKCDGLDTVANISVNGKSVGQANNYHRRYFFNLADIVKAGENQLDITFESAANYSERAAAAYPYSVLVDGVYFNHSLRNFVRKTQSDFGWDWGPAFVPTGIWQNISIVTFEPVYVSYVVPKSYFEQKSGSYQLTVLVCVELPQAVSPGLTVMVKSTAPYVPDTSGMFEASVKGETCHSLMSALIPPDTIEEHLWWPHTVGDTPTLLSVTTTVDIFSSQSDQLSHIEVVKRVGFRRIGIMQDPVGPQGKDGLMFYFQMNTSLYGNFPIYAKGSNFIPMDAFVNRATPEYARRLLQSAISGNQNMIRVWGGGLYQTDWFYDLCDELGIMVWQEFMFADALYPRDKAFLDNVRAEVVHQVRRLGHHPSIVLWSGNNENQGFAQGDPAKLVDYSVLYDGTIRATLWDEDITRPYWPSSPSNGAIVDDKEKQLYIQRWGQSGNPNYGDVHRYDYSDYCTDVTKFPRPRFASEFGFQSYPSFSSLIRISGPTDWDNNSTFMNHRQHHPDGNFELQQQMSYFFHLPNNTNHTIKFMDFIYLTQVIQAICISAEAQHYRRLLSEDGAFTRGTLYWQLNDIWQAQSWASVEYSGQWKLLHYFMKHVYAPILISPYEMEGSIGIYVVNDQPHKSISYSLEVQVITWAKGVVVTTFTKDALNSSGFTGVQVWKESVKNIFNKTSVNESFLYMRIADSKSQEKLAENWFFPANFTSVALPTPNMSASDFNQTQQTVTFTLSSTAVAPFVMLDSGEINGIFNDNGFLMMPGVKYQMSFTSWEQFDVKDFTKNLQTRTVRDTY